MNSTSRKGLYLALSLLLLPLVSCAGNGGSSTSASDSSTSSTSIEYGFEKAASYEIEETEAPYQGVGYEIFTGAYYDGSGDGKGDFKGIEQKLPYIKELGFERIWLTPIHPSPSYHGYDVIDYYDVRSDFGTLDDFDSLVKSAHELGLEVIIDLVLNHSSSQNPWFIQSAQDYRNDYSGTNSKKDWYVWSEHSAGGYAYNSTAEAYYECNFDSGMPEFDLDNEEVRSEIENIVSFWLNDHDIDGFRLDAVIWYYVGNASSNKEFLRWFKDTCLAIKEDAYIIGEAMDNSQTFIYEYARSTGLSYFNFPTSQKNSSSPGMMLQNETNASRYGKTTAEILTKFKRNAPESYFSNMVSNHDLDRPYNYFLVKGEREEDYKKALASLYLLTPGTPWVYYGEEIDLWGTRGSENSDIARRLSMIWGNGNPRADNLENYDDSSKQTSPGANVLLEEAFSLTNHYKKVINLRNKYPNLFDMDSTWEGADLTSGIAGFKISDAEGNVYYLYHNVAEEAREADLPASMDVVEEIYTSTYKAKKEGDHLILPSFNSILLKE